MSKAAAYELLKSLGPLTQAKLEQLPTELQDAVTRALLSPDQLATVDAVAIVLRDAAREMESKLAALTERIAKLETAAAERSPLRVVG